MAQTIRPMRYPVRLLRGRWPAALEHRAARLFRDDPSVVMDEDCTDAQFRAAMGAFRLGDTIKITGRNRHPEADGLLTDHVDTRGLTILDVGASDGSTSVDLMESLPGFAAYVIADLYLHVYAVAGPRHTAFFSEDGICSMVVGRRVVGWPAQSRLVATAYAPLLRRLHRNAATRRKVLLVNPRARSLAADDPRISFAVHDVFTPWIGVRPDVIKVANLLRRDYFSDAMLERAFYALLDSLDDGGHLLVVNNPRIEGVPWEGALYQRREGRFHVRAQTEHPLDVDDLVIRAGRQDTEIV